MYEDEANRLKRHMDLAERTALLVDEPTSDRLRSFARSVRERLRQIFQHQRTKARAHQLWEEAGKPEGHDDHFWFEAERQFQEERTRGAEDEKRLSSEGINHQASTWK